MNAESLAALITDIKGDEGVIPWLYRDSSMAGNVTCAVGHFCGTLADVQTLPFAPPITQADWEALMSLPPGRVASFYEKATWGRLTLASIDSILMADINEVLGRLRVDFPLFDQFPDPAQRAITDLAFNLGVYGLVNEFPKLTAAIDRQDWPTAALECRREGISEARNQQTVALFLAD